MEHMLEPMSDSQYKTMKEQMSEVQHEAMYERVIQRTIKINCEDALAMVNQKMKKNDHPLKIQCLLELKARILWYKKVYDKDILNALGETFRSAGVFRFPLTYLVYGSSMHIKEGSGSQLNIYRLGLEEARKKEDEDLFNEFKIRIQPLEEAELRRLNKSKNKMKGRMKMDGEKQEEDQIVVKDVDEEEELQNVQNVVDEMAEPEHKVSKKKYKPKNKMKGKMKIEGDHIVVKHAMV